MGRAQQFLLSTVQDGSPATLSLCPFAAANVMLCLVGSLVRLLADTLGSSCC